MIISNRFYTDVENSIPFSSIWDRNLDRTVQASDSYLRENRIPRRIFEESCNTWRAPIVTSRQEFVWRFFWKVILLESPRGRQKRERDKNVARKREEFAKDFLWHSLPCLFKILQVISPWAEFPADYAELYPDDRWKESSDDSLPP